MEPTGLTNKQQYLVEIGEEACKELIGYLRDCYDKYKSSYKAGRSSEIFFCEPTEIAEWQAHDIICECLRDARETYVKSGKLPESLSVLIEDFSGIDNDMFKLDTMVNPFKMVLLEIGREDGSSDDL